MTIENAIYWCELFTDSLVKADVGTKKRKLGLQAMKVCKSALEKQIPKKPKTGTQTIGWLNGEEIKSSFYACPCCKRYIGQYEGKYNFCPKCGQALDWSDTR